MNAELKEKWLEALESGRYSHGKFALRTTKDTYCCLGVLADVMELGWEDEPGPSETYFIRGTLHNGMLPEKTMDIAGIACHDCSHLMSINDSANSYAPAIAYIREKL